VPIYQQFIELFWGPGKADLVCRKLFGMKHSFLIIGGLLGVSALTIFAVCYRPAPGHVSDSPLTAALASGSPSGQRLVKLEDLHELRAAHSATLLPDGKVLIVAGFRKGPDTYSQLYSATSEIYDPVKHSFSYAGSLHVARCGQTATLLANGREVLVTGGNNDQERLASAEIYNTVTGQWTRLPDMLEGRQGHQAVLLKNGKVLIVGGTDDPDKSIELYNPATRSFERGDPAPYGLGSASVVPLKDGRILIAGGGKNYQPTAFAIIYDPAANRFDRVGDMMAVRYKTAAALLPDGRALIIGGSNNRDWKGKYRSTELFDPGTSNFIRGPELNYERFKLTHAVSTLKNGAIIVTGGDKHIEELDPVALKWNVIGTLDQPYYFSTSTLMPGGDILLTGGYGNDAQPTSKAWIFTH
jgi:N-acetylneuraminic acid mutarotase